MKKLIVGALVLFVCSLSAYSQAKGVDQSSERIRDSGGSQSPANNGSQQNVGAGRGMDFGAGRTPETPVIPNPYRLTSRRDAIIQSINNLMRDRNLILDESASKVDEGILVTQPYTFTKGAVVSLSELNRYAELPETTARGWTRGRYTLTIEVQSIDGTSANISVTAKIEGRTDGATGAEWTTLRSSGLAEQTFLGALIGDLTGVTPPGIQP